MEDFRRQFLVETAEKLENLQRNLRDGEKLSAENKRDALRVLHTVKGTAQTFGYASTSRLAHDLETLLCANGNGQNLLVEGIGFLQQSLTANEFRLPEQFTEKLKTIVPPPTAANVLREDLPEIPDEFYSQLSIREKEIINAALRDEKKIAVLEIDFEPANFAAGLINFREILSSEGEIVATFPNAKSGAKGKIGFQFLTIGLENAHSLATGNSASVLWETSEKISENNLESILRQIVRHGKEVAARFDKKIEIETEIDTIDLTSAELKLIFETLLHLVRNAVDHAIEKTGAIKIKLKNEPNALRLTVADDGRGIDLDKLKAKAIEKNIISTDKNLSEAATLDLIFQPEFSTKTETTEISGRGIGLDAVKNAVEEFGGKISVATEKGKGTTFEISIPRDQI